MSRRQTAQRTDGLRDQQGGSCSRRPSL